ncbi:MAG: peptide-methionine (R)-S-oxide reductase [Lentisphaeraceae bacterium]|nr:peptide-methionine (R)-S-oxide reductase [Lentisphaeraceae bacterium]
MQKRVISLLVLLVIPFTCNKQSKYNALTEDEHYILIEKGTEKRYSGKYDNFYEDGAYICKQCDSPLFLSNAKFNSKSGWPSFDEMIEGRVKIKDSTKVYSEITCVNCEGHLGHLKKGEKFTEKNKRYCVNSLALKFIPKAQKNANQ